MKKVILFIGIMFLFAIEVRAVEDLTPNAKSAIMIEASTGEIIYEKEKDTQLPMASMTKIMTT